MAIGFLCLGLATGLLMRRQNEREIGIAEALASFDRFVASETALRHNVVSARVGIVRDYDETVQLSDRTERALSQLEANFRLFPDQVDRLGRVAVGVAEQLTLVERFKSRNAVLRNALAAFSLLCAQLDTATLASDQRLAATKLGMAILDLTLNTAPDVVSRVDRQLEAMTQVQAAGQSGWRALIRQAETIRTRLPDMDVALRTLSSIPDDTDIRELSKVAMARQAMTQAVAQRYRYALTGLSGALMLILVRLGYIVRARASALRRRAGFERVLAEISGRLSELAGAGAERQISTSLAMLADITGADHAYVTLGPNSAITYSWSRGGWAPESWWVRAMDALVQGRATAEGSQLQVYDARQCRSAAERALLETAGLRGLAAARRADAGLLALSWSREPTGIAETEAGMLTVILELLIQAQTQVSLAREHARLELSLRQARRMETIGAFASGIAHNFNNILAAMLGHAEIAELLQENYGGPTSNLQALRAAGERGQELVASILAFGRRDGAGPRLVDGRAILAETVTLLQATWPADVVFHLEGDAARVPIAGNETQLQQVLLNLCRNAAQAITGAGKVWVSLETIDAAEPIELSHGTVQAGRYAQFRVRDTGRGMSRETLAVAFEPFFTARVGGNGLGLATAWAIVQDHNGCWNVLSSPAMGSIFEVWLPLADAEFVPEMGSNNSMPTGQGQAVLLVNPDRQYLLRDEEFIAAFGFEPVGFHDPAMALAACRSDPQRFSIIVITGVRQLSNLAHFVGGLRLCVPLVPILLAVGASSELDLDALSKAGLSDIVAYGDSAGDLGRALVSWTARRDPTRPPSDVASDVGHPESEL